jgi:hypothetical protein
MMIAGPADRLRRTGNVLKTITVSASLFISKEIVP